MSLMLDISSTLGWSHAQTKRLLKSLTIDLPQVYLLQQLKEYHLCTYQHCLRVLALTVHLCPEIAASKKEYYSLCRAALFHDIGKLSTPLEILDSTNKLSTEEYDIIKEHSHAGCTIAASYGMSAPVCLAILHHHERMDGSGYPYGLSNYKIPEFSRIIGVLDVYDALSSVRPYHNAMEKSDAFELIDSMNGLDLNIVRALGLFEHFRESHNEHV